MKNQNGSIVLERETDAGAHARAPAQGERFNRNSAWLQAHSAEVYSQYRGRCIFAAGEELFAADAAREAIALATAAHPNDDKWFTRYIPKESGARIYANQGGVAGLR